VYLYFTVLGYFWLSALTPKKNKKKPVKTPLKTIINQISRSKTIGFSTLK